MKAVANRSTTSCLGLRICGMSLGAQKLTSDQGKSLTPQTFKETLFSFLSTPSLDDTLVLSRHLQERVALLKNELSLHPIQAYSSSLFIAYDAAHPLKVAVYWIDFAHSYFVEEAFSSDDGVMFGLLTLESIIKEWIELILARIPISN